MLVDCFLKTNMLIVQVLKNASALLQTMLILPLISLTSEHQGWKIEGLNKYYSGNSVALGLGFADAALVWTDKQKCPYPLGFKGYLYDGMASNKYRSLTPSELMLELTRKANKALKIKAVVFDGGITARPALRELKREKIPFVGRIKTSNIITFQEKKTSIKKLAQGIQTWNSTMVQKFEVLCKTRESKVF